MIYAPYIRLASNADAAAAKRKEIAERLRKGEEVRITNSGQVVEPTNPEAVGGKTLKAPEGKLA
ncbi:hypothetical protein HGI81_04070 [Olsenella sp. KGMB02461]|nr:hypothetical protein [Olsenella sp. KGMB02461]